MRSGSPSVVVLHNQTATLQVGDEVPITTRQAQSVINPEAPLVNEIERAPRDGALFRRIQLSRRLVEEITLLAVGAFEARRSPEPGLHDVIVDRKR